MELELGQKLDPHHYNIGGFDIKFPYNAEGC